MVPELSCRPLSCNPGPPQPPATPAQVCEGQKNTPRFTSEIVLRPCSAAETLQRLQAVPSVFNFPFQQIDREDVVATRGCDDIFQAVCVFYRLPPDTSERRTRPAELPLAPGRALLSGEEAGLPRGNGRT